MYKYWNYEKKTLYLCVTFDKMKQMNNVLIAVQLFFFFTFVHLKLLDEQTKMQQLNKITGIKTNESNE